MKKLLLTLFILIIATTTQAQYGNKFSKYIVNGDFIGTFQVFNYFSSPREAGQYWKDLSYEKHLTLEVGYGDDFINPINDIRLVASNGNLICTSDLYQGCNWFTVKQRRQNVRN